MISLRTVSEVSEPGVLRRDLVDLRLLELHHIALAEGAEISPSETSRFSLFSSILQLPDNLVKGVELATFCHLVPVWRRLDAPLSAPLLRALSLLRTLLVPVLRFMSSRVNSEMILVFGNLQVVVDLARGHELHVPSCEGSGMTSELIRLLNRSKTKRTRRYPPELVTAIEPVVAVGIRGGREERTGHRDAGRYDRHRRLGEFRGSWSGPPPFGLLMVPPSWAEAAGRISTSAIPWPPTRTGRRQKTKRRRQARQ